MVNWEAKMNYQEYQEQIKQMKLHNSKIEKQRQKNIKKLYLWGKIKFILLGLGKT